VYCSGDGWIQHGAQCVGVGCVKCEMCIAVVMAGYSTERSESYAADTQQTATLDLKHRRRHNLTSPTPTYDSAGCYSPDMVALHCLLTCLLASVVCRRRL